MAGRSASVRDLWEQERVALRPLPAERFPLEEISTARVDSFSRVLARTNRYSVPVTLVGLKVEVRLSAREVRLLHAGQEVARHERLLGRHGERLQLDHYLELLRLKPAAMARSRPLSQERSEGRWPELYERFWGELRRRHGEGAGTRQMVEVLLLCRQAEAQEVHAAVLQAHLLGCFNADAVAVLLRQLQRPEPELRTMDGLGALERYGRQEAVPLSAYDGLLPGRKEVLA